jgi:hypothetical protein
MTLSITQPPSSLLTRCLLAALTAIAVLISLEARAQAPRWQKLAGISGSIIINKTSP